MEVTVAVLGNPAYAFESKAFEWKEGGGAIQLDLPYEQSPKVTLEVAGSERLGSVLARAAETARVQLPDYFEGSYERAISFIDFYRADCQPEPRYSLILVDRDGHARWGVPFREATYEELVRAGSAGTLRGDPLRPYLFLLGPQGNGIGASWAGLLEGLRILWELVKMFGEAGGAYFFAREVLRQASDRLGRGKQAVQDNYLRWDERGARPPNFAELLSLGPWSNADLAERLDCTEGEAEAILWAYGFTPAPSGLWRREGDSPAALLRAAVDEVSNTHAWNPLEGFERAYKERASTFLETGQFPDDPTIFQPDYGPKDW